MAKKQRTAEELYNHNKKKAKVCRVLAPIVYWGGIVLGIVFLALAIKNSFGNIAEIIAKLDSKTLTGEQIEQNYNALVEKYGEWVIGKTGGGFYITFINIGHALFSGLMIFCLCTSILCFVGAKVIGKWALPVISKNIEQENQDTINLTILRNEDNKNQNE